MKYLKESFSKEDEAFSYTGEKYDSGFNEEIRLKNYQDVKISDLLGICDEKNIINIFTDGSYNWKKRYRIGYSFVVEYDENVAHIQNGHSVIGKAKKPLGALYAESIACLKAMEYVLKKNLDHVMIYTDNLFLFKALKGISFKTNHILNTFLNKAKILLLKLKKANLHVDFRHVRGHGDCYGNIIADILAKKGSKKHTAAYKFISGVESNLRKEEIF